MSRLRSLQDFIAAGLDTIVECRGCGRRVRADPRRLLAGVPAKWRHDLGYQGSKLRCIACQHRGARLAPSPKVLSPLDCDNFRADIERLWEKVMAENLTGQCKAKIAEPDGDGLVYVVSNTDEAHIVGCLGTEAEACELMSQWLAARDYQENAG